MIREFWQERREEKKQLKQLKKENKKLPKTREQKAYKIFGFLFVVFIIFGSISFTCRSSGQDVDYSWENVVGITDEMKTALTAKFDKAELLTDPIDAIDWGSAKEALTKAGLEDIIVDNKISDSVLQENNIKIVGDIRCNESVVGGLSKHLLSMDDNSKYINLLQLSMYEEGNNIYLESIMTLDLSLLVYETALPIIYVRSTSMLDILDNKLSALGTKVQINDIEEELNNEIVKTINGSSYFEIAFFTNNMIVSNLNGFAEQVGAKIILQGTQIVMTKK